MKHLIHVLIFLLSSTFAAQAVDFPSQMRFHCDRDTAEITDMLVQLYAQRLSPEAALTAAADMLAGRPYEANTLEGTPEMLTINVHSMDCMTFVENALALALATQAPAPSWRAFMSKLENLRYRKGEISDYSSRLHYFALWVAENIYRGNIREITDNMPTAVKTAKSLDYMTRNRDKYPALADSANYEGLRFVEEGLRRFAIPYAKKEAMSRKDLKEMLHDGDIIAIVSREPGLDTSHVGIIRIIDGEPHMMHASPKAGAIVTEQQSISDYFKHEGRNALGFRVLRITE